MEPLLIAAIGSLIAGALITALGLIAMIRSLRDAPARLVALGITYLGMFVAIVGGLLLLLAAMVGGRLPILAGIPPFALIGFTAIRIRLAASRAFQDARMGRTT
jgi:hypothetical protein